MSILSEIHPKLPMRNVKKTKTYYIDDLGFSLIAEYEGYLIVRKDDVEIHFFEFKELNPDINYGQVYIRTTDVKALFNKLINQGVTIHPNGHLASKPWGQIEFSVLDPDKNLLTFAQKTI